MNRNIRSRCCFFIAKLPDIVSHSSVKVRRTVRIKGTHKNKDLECRAIYFNSLSYTRRIFNSYLPVAFLPAYYYE